MEYTSEQLNYFRICYIAFNLVPEGLRKIFKQEWDFLYKTTPFGEWKDTPKNGSDFYNNESRKSRKKQPNARFLATIQNGNTTEWDCSCLFFAILFSDSIGSSLGPAVKRDVDDLRQVRNDIAHGEAKLTDAEFMGYADRVLLAFNSLNLPISEIDRVKNQTSFPTAEVNNLKIQVDNLKDELKKAKDTIQKKEEQVECLTQEINSKIESFCNLAFKPSHEIIRRSNDVTRIITKMQELQDGSHRAVSTVYLSGNPGSGKSQLARQIGQQIFTVSSRESEGLTFVATLNAETLETLADSYISLAKQLGITEYALTNLATSKVNSLKERIQYLQRLILPKIKQFFYWLVIADNVVDLSMARSYLPQTSSEEWGHGQVLITTQDSSSIPTSAPHTYHKSLSAGMQPDDAVELLKQVSQISNHEQAKQVAEALEYQPLALAAAAFYVQTVVSNGSPNYSWTNYLEAFVLGKREATEEPLARGNAAYSKTMTTAIRMAVNSSSGSDEVIRQAFCFLSLCSSESLPIEAAVNFVKVRTSGHTEELIKAKILKSSLITCLYSEDGAPEYLRVHNVVYQVLKKLSTFDSQYTKRVQCLSQAVIIFHSLIESESKHVFESRQVCMKLRKITTHCKVLHDIFFATFAARGISMVNDLTHFISPDNVVSWLCSTAAVCCDLTNPSYANLFSSSACDFVHHIGRTREGDVLKADVYTVHGRALSMQCQNQLLSISYHNKATNIYIAIYGKEHCKVATNYNYLGEVYRTIGNYNKAKKYHEKALFVSKKILCEEHADVLATSYNHLGTDHYRVGQYKQAQEYHKKALAIRKMIYSDEHAVVAASYNNLGNDHYGLGQYNQAIEYHKKALVVWEKIYCEEHAHVAMCNNNLATVYYSLEQYNQAQEYHKKALVIRRKIYGEEHAKVATSYNNLGTDHWSLGQYDQAQEYHNKALVIRKKIHGEEHADVATSYNDLGTDHYDLGQYNQAQECHKKALAIRKKIYGKGHADVATSYNDLGNDHRGLGQYNQAHGYHKTSLVIRRRIYGEEHAKVATSYNNLGTDHYCLGQYKQSQECLKKALVIRKNIYGEGHALVAESYNNLSFVDSFIRQYNQSRKNNCISVM